MQISVQPEYDCVAQRMICAPFDSGEALAKDSTIKARPEQPLKLQTVYGLSAKPWRLQAMRHMCITDAYV